MPLSYQWNPCPVSLLGIRDWGFGMEAESFQGNKSASELKEHYPNPITPIPNPQSPCLVGG